MIDKRITSRKNFQGGGADASTTSFSKSFDRQMGTNTASRANKTVDRRQKEGQDQADRDNRRIELNRLARQSAAEKAPDVKPNPFQRGGGGIGQLLASLLGFAMGIPGLGLAFSKKGMKFIGDKLGRTNPDGTPMSTKQFEKEMYDKRQQNRLDKLFAAKDRGFNQIGFGDFTKKTVDFTPGQQAKIDELLAKGYLPSTARDVDSARGSNLRNDLTTTIKELAQPNINELAQPNITDKLFRKNFNSFPGMGVTSQPNINNEFGQSPQFNASLINEFGQSPQFNTALTNEFGTADRGIIDSNAAFAFGLPYGTSDQGYVSPYGTPDDPEANVLPTSNEPKYMFAGNYSQNAVGNQLYGKEYDVLNPFEQEQINKAIETYGTKSTGQLASGTSSDI